jgi:sulfatase maturation enzyme AslB (radical SAM superfamily)
MTDGLTSSFVPLARLRRSAPSKPVSHQDVLSDLGEHLDRFAEGLTQSELALLSSLLKSGARDPSFRALIQEPPEAVFQPAELEMLHHLLSRPAPTGQSLRSTLVLIMKATRHCNLRCTYCRSWSDQTNQTMTFEVLARSTY